MKASIVIANYNNAKYIKDCINSLKNQTFKNFEIIFFDDNSNDNSINEVLKFSEIQIIRNKNQTKFGSLNQLKAFDESIKVSSGDLIFFLDSDDYFHETKLEKIVNKFNTDRNIKVVYDFPIIFGNKKEKVLKKKNKKLFKTYWDYIHPTSCITIKKQNVFDILNCIKDERFTDVWMDLRIHLYTKHVNNDYLVINENLTYYRQSQENVSSKFKKFSKNWWTRRYDAYEYFFSFAKKNNFKVKKNLDYKISKIINNLIK